MILKRAEGADRDVATLQRLLTHPRITPKLTQQIELEIKRIRAGASGERSAAYYLDFDLASTDNWVVIHDLRIEIDHMVAQIDHLLINRLLDIWVCESKAFTNGIKINEHGEFVTFYERRPHGVPSPIEQNMRHVRALEALFSTSAVKFPTRLGMTIRPKLQSVILVSKGSIQRPKINIPGIDTIIKADQVVGHIRKRFETGNPLDIAKLISIDTLSELGNQIVSHHRPIVFDWAKRFGLEERRGPIGRTTASAVAVPAEPPTAAGCERCGGQISVAEIRYCKAHSARFLGLALCRNCQPKKTLA